MVYGPYYRQRGAITGTPATPEALYGEDVRRPAIRSDDLYERYGEASPYEGVQTANKRAITGIDQGSPTGAVSSEPGNPGQAGPGWLSELAYFQGLPGGRAPEGSPNLGIGTGLIGRTGSTLLSMLGEVPGWLSNFMVNPALRAVIFPMVYSALENIWGEQNIYNMEDSGYENPTIPVFNADEGMAIPGDVMTPGGEALSGYGSPEGGFTGYGGEPM